MLVKVLSFGSNWWQRSREISEPSCCAYYNSTGVRCGRKIRRHWILPGILRLNGVSNFDPTRPMRAVAHTFRTSGLTCAFGGNRLLFESRAPDSLSPDFFLIAINSRFHGSIDFTSGVWKSVFTQVVAVSQLRDMQETLLLMGAADWIQTSLGFWQLHVPSRRPEPPSLLRLAPAASEAKESP
jgi:hypothetical protein